VSDDSSSSYSARPFLLADDVIIVDVSIWLLNCVLAKTTCLVVAN